MTIKTKCIYEPSEKGDGLRVLITRYYPRGVRKDRFDEWVRSLSPSRELLSSYRRGSVDWDGFAGAFVREIAGSSDSRGAIRRLGDMISRQGQVVTLLCFERAHLPCHRHIVRAIIEDPSLLEAEPRRLALFGN
jgi:uncharacterized protein YeaO (DUF488 family)